jgi:hypothetical protein
MVRLASAETADRHFPPSFSVHELSRWAVMANFSSGDRDNNRVA